MCIAECMSMIWCNTATTCAPHNILCTQQLGFRHWSSKLFFIHPITMKTLRKKEEKWKRKSQGNDHGRRNSVPGYFSVCKVRWKISRFWPLLSSLFDYYFAGPHREACVSLFAHLNNYFNGKCFKAESQALFPPPPQSMRHFSSLLCTVYTVLLSLLYWLLLLGLAWVPFKVAALRFSYAKLHTFLPSNAHCTSTWSKPPRFIGYARSHCLNSAIEVDFGAVSTV